jgi:glucose-1-phosphatase
MTVRQIRSQRDLAEGLYGRHESLVETLWCVGSSLISMTESDIEFVLFDLGGVLIELGQLTDLQALTGFPGDRDTWQQILEPWICRFERGECSANEFSTGVVTDWRVDITPARWLEILQEWPIGPYPGTTEVLLELQQAVAIGCLSNTNALHWEDQSARWPVLETFDHRFLSFELGVRKPDIAIYQAVDERLPHKPDRVLFLDDLGVNVAAARSFGFLSEQVQGLDEVVTVLKESGLLAAWGEVP